eukprot:gb/GFBE01003132.1/.p1 GENE.gb/GFBE01003132.1/~~gb/GFBE01003132.1/.p1  ORF type:complete len:213 (+),score=27.94 gb/GFBE01003132.1/:1-639(+)
MGSRSGSAIGRPRGSSRGSQVSRVSRRTSEGTLARVSTAPELNTTWPSGCPRRPGQLLWWSEDGMTGLFPPSLQRHDLTPLSLEVAKPGPTYRDHEKAYLYKQAWNGSGPFTATSNSREKFLAADSRRMGDLRGQATFSSFKESSPIEGTLESSDYSGCFRNWSLEEMAAARSRPVFTSWHCHVEGPPDFSSPKKMMRQSWQKQAGLSRKAK